MNSTILRHLLAGLALLIVAAPARAAIVVTTAADLHALDGACSFREALEAINFGGAINECTDTDGTNSGQYNFIVFSIPGSGVKTISLQSQLPGVYKRLLIDATPQASACSPAPNVGIELVNGNNLTGDGLLLLAGSDYSIIGGLAISGFANGAGIKIDSNNVLLGCDLIGTDPTGMIAHNNSIGVRVTGSEVYVGKAASDVWLPNLIAGNSKNVQIDSSAVNAHVAGNYIGVDASGLATLVPGSAAMLVQGSGTRIGFGADTGPTARTRNIVSGAIAMGGLNIVIAGNYIGVGVDGHTPLVGGGQIVVESASDLALIGCDGTADWDDCRNVIANPDSVAILDKVGTSDVSTVAIVSNFIGVAADGITLTGTHDGITFKGGTALVARNLIRTSGTGIFLGPDPQSGIHTTFLNNTMVGTSGATLDSSDNCLQGNTFGVLTPDPGPTTFAGNWWGAADGPSGNNGGSGDYASSDVTVTPFLTAPSVYCSRNAIFANSFE